VGVNDASAAPLSTPGLTTSDNSTFRRQNWFTEKSKYEERALQQHVDKITHGDDGF
jgi:hypothetical protein